MVKGRELSKETESKIFVAIGVLGFIGALLCLSPNMTGNAIGTLNTDSSNLLGIVFLVIGIASVGVAKIRD